MQKVKKKIPEKLMKGIPLTIRPGHTIRLKGTNEPLTYGCWSRLQFF
jgi:hypothetical protein